MTERARMPRSGVSEIQVLAPTGTSQHIDVLATSAATTNAVNTNVVRVSTTVDVCIAIGSAPTAIGASTAGAALFMPAGAVEYFKVVAGTDKVAAIAQDEATAGGVVYVDEMR